VYNLSSWHVSDATDNILLQTSHLLLDCNMSSVLEQNIYFIDDLSIFVLQENFVILRIQK